MMTKRKRITGRLESGPRGFAIATEAGEFWVLEGYEPESDLVGRQVIAEGTVSGYDRLRAEWMGAADT